ncbi:MAG: hypothetical protein ATN36_05650 [Epulopiscium sp. Nele67-Bin005]|nr:MAG: hypothetical protein ATN36_05650 [Epulopiscium sp. Nele67-Bin005]
MEEIEEEIIPEVEEIEEEIIPEVEEVEEEIIPEVEEVEEEIIPEVEEVEEEIIPEVEEVEEEIIPEVEEIEEEIIPEIDINDVPYTFLNGTPIPDEYVNFVEQNQVELTAIIKNPAFSSSFIVEEHWANELIEGAIHVGILEQIPSNVQLNQPVDLISTFTMLDRVLLMNDNSNMNLSRNIVDKYIPKEIENYYSVASVASKLTEPTLLATTQLENQLITREVLAQIVYEITKANLLQSSENPAFSDIENTAYYTAIQYCIRVGLLNGTDEGLILPEKVLTQAELIAILVRLNEELNK